MIKQGDNVKYIGTALPKYTGKILKVRRCLVNNNYMLWLPKENRHQLALEHGGIWGVESLICGREDIEEAGEPNE
ncbi:hypothetical protein [Enterococcus sp. 5H]|uniref:hypothetical protein n=1 Tax=Enterococcus sp. 5H TaxID=1229490 RepID=UPI002303B4AB|nr:hypothetical protein [Enterococcus sp. 5H]MDA9472075.1 hypothetical protein [Enterococcus sp. 5H]